MEIDDRLESRRDARRSSPTARCLRDLVVPTTGGLQSVTLGLNSIEDYVQHSPSFGAVPGRYANRIANGRFSLDGVAYTLERKPGDNHTLAWRPEGIRQAGLEARRSQADDFVTLIAALAGRRHAGFPGEMQATCVYRFLEPATLRVELTAVADKPTLVNLTQHAYFNLDGSPDILDHELELACDFYTPSDAELIPDRRDPRRRGNRLRLSNAAPIRNAAGVTYDTNFVASRAPRSRRACFRRATSIAEKRCERSSCTAPSPACRSTIPPSSNCPVPGLDGAHYGAHAGLCLEPQAFPDSPNRRHFTDTVLRPDREYRHISEFRFG